MDGWNMLEYYHFLFPCTNHQVESFEVKGYPEKLKFQVFRLHAFPLQQNRRAPPDHQSIDLLGG